MSKEMLSQVRVMAFKPINNFVIPKIKTKMLIVFCIILIFLNCSKGIREVKKEDSVINCAKSSVSSNDFGKLIVKVETDDDSFYLENVSFNFSKQIPPVNKDTFFWVVIFSPLIIPTSEVTIPIVKDDSICNPNLNLRKGSNYEIKLPVGEYYSSLSNDHERDFQFEASEDKLILFMFGYLFDKSKKNQTEFQSACQNKFENYIWGYNGGRGGFVRNLNVCPKIKIEKEKTVTIKIVVSEKLGTDIGEKVTKYIPGILLFGLGPITNRPLAYYNIRKYEIFME